MLFDCHIHSNFDPFDKKLFLDRLKKSGIDGGVVISPSPKCSVFSGWDDSWTAHKRLNRVFEITGNSQNLFPFFWIDPTEESALEQVAEALERGIMGFKVICSNFLPGDSRAMKTYSAIANANKPILFHSGILWDRMPSSKNNRPVEFEALLDIDNLQFALAHASWPWHDECIAMYGKFQDAFDGRPGHGEIFIDTTPGTPEIYREDLLTKLYKVGYNVENNILFGTDRTANNFDVEESSLWVELDNKLLKKLDLSDQTIDKYFSGNLKRFLGI